MKAIVVFKSTSGFTKRYAEWIAEELGADLSCAGKAGKADLMKYDVVIFGGCLHAVGISGIELIKGSLDALVGKSIVVFAVGASPWSEAIVEELEERNFTKEERARIKLFYMRGGFNLGKLGFPYRILMILFKYKLEMKKKKTADEEGMIRAYANPVDFTVKEYIGGLTDYVKALKSDAPTMV